jgi:hypothetical protein
VNTYAEKLLDPRWQKKRLEVMERAGFECESCGAGDKTLTVHHSYYEWGLEPWEYPNESLHCFCQPCHHKAQELYRSLKRQLGKISPWDLDLLIGVARGLEISTDPDNKVEVDSYETAQGISLAWSFDVGDANVVMKPETIIKALVGGAIDGWRMSELTTVEHLKHVNGECLLGRTAAPEISKPG